MYKNWVERNSDCFYVTFRVLIGLLFMQHGLQKIFGLFTERGGVELMSLMGFAGMVELVGGLAIAVGFFTRLSAFGSMAIMLGAFFTAHFKAEWPAGIIPIMNRGELALVYFAAFLVVFAMGARKWSLERAILGKEFF